MKTVNVSEMRNVNGGATYTTKCKYCGKKFTGKYLLWNGIVKTITDLKCHNHETKCFSEKQLGW